MAFYGYIFSAGWYIFEHQIKSTLGLAYVESVKDRYKYDFINYHRKDLDWLAFVSILMTSNIGLMMINQFVLHEETKSKLKDIYTDENALQSLMF